MTDVNTPLEQGAPLTIDQTINGWFEPISFHVNAVLMYSVEIAGKELPLILIWLGFAALFFTLYLGFVNIRYFGHAFKLLFRSKVIDKDAPGEITQFQALMASLSGTVGLGNIGGVAVAISVGGPGAALWMTILGVLGMSSKFVEVTLGVKYRVQKDPENPRAVTGGPMYYTRAWFDRAGLSLVGKILAVFFAIACIIGAIGGGNMYQANQAFEQSVAVTSVDGASFLDGYGWAFGLVLSVLVAVVIMGGLKSIAKVASKLVPFMALVYVCMGLYVIGFNVDQLMPAIQTITDMAFSPEAGIGGVLGAIFVGIQRAAFSNEAGLGSAAIVQSTANSKEPVETGMVAMLGPFFDTIIVCNITAIVIVISGAYVGVDPDNVKGVALTSEAFESVLPSFKYALTAAVILFAYSTLISWYYYGAVGFKYLFGENKFGEYAFKLIFCACVVVGSSMNLKHLMAFSDATFLSMAIPNIIALYLFAPEVKKDLKDYVQRIKSKE